jgi:hypothetical protein
MRVLLLLVMFACGGGKADERFKQVATDFAQKLVARDAGGAHAMLDKSLAATLSAAQLQSTFDEMMSPAGSAKGVALMEAMTSWPAKQPEDACWAYVAIEGTEGSEGLTLTITSDGRVRQIEWGRP